MCYNLVRKFFNFKDYYIALQYCTHTFKVAYGKWVHHAFPSVLQRGTFHDILSALMRGHEICFYWDIWKIIFELSLVQVTPSHLELCQTRPLLISCYSAIQFCCCVKFSLENIFRVKLLIYNYLWWWNGAREEDWLSWVMSCIKGCTDTLTDLHRTLHLVQSNYVIH